MSNEMISVPRELLERILGCIGYEEKDELRALLDAPAVERKTVLAVKRYDRDSVSGHSDVEIALSEHRIMHHDHGPNLAEALARLAGRVARFHKLRAPSLAAQPQGEPVAEVYRGPVSGISRIRWIEYKTAPVGTKLYAEQPAPVAVALPERKREATEESDIMIDCQNEGWNACLDEVARLNPPQQ